jgi:hypothetical protein
MSLIADLGKRWPTHVTDPFIIQIAWLYTQGNAQDGICSRRKHKTDQPRTRLIRFLFKYQSCRALSNALNGICRRRNFDLLPFIEHTMRPTITEVDGHSNHHPNDETEPCIKRQHRHHAKSRKDTQNRHRREERRFKWSL